MVETIRALCKKNGTTIKALEEELHIGKATIRRWDENAPSIEKVALVAARFDASLDYLVTGKEKQPTEYGELSTEEINLLGAFRGLTPDQRQFVLRQLRAAAQDPADQDAAE